jgi:hypothetical protein
VTNAEAEGLNSKIMTINRRACGYRNKEYFKTAIYFFCGGLSLYPRKTRKDHYFKALLASYLQSGAPPILLSR